MNVRRLITGTSAMVVIGWIALMVSYWLPGAIGQALQNTALCLLLPGAFGTAGLFFCWEELENYHPQKKAAPLRCTDCGSKILNAAGTTVGDQIEGELMIEPWTPPTTSPFRKTNY